MRRGSLLLALLALLAAAMLVAAGCTTTPPTNQTTTPTPAGNVTVLPTANVTGNATANVTGNVTPVNTTVTNGTAANITTPFVNATWGWVARAGSESISVSNPNTYTIAFHQNGTYALKADCNTGAGNFTVNATKMKIMPANLTTKYCGDASLDRKLVPALAQVTGYQMDSTGRLVLIMVNPNERLIFTKLVAT